jgi:hypothetical protein
MTSRNALDAFAVARGEGLHPRLLELFDRTTARPFSELAVRSDGMLQAGPDPASETRAVPSNTAIPVRAETRTALAIRLIRVVKPHPAQE